LGLAEFAGSRRHAATAEDVLDALDCLRVAVTLFDSQERLVYCNAHYGYLFPSLPPAESLIGATYETLIRLEVEGGEIADVHCADKENFIEARRRRVEYGDFRPFDIHLADGRIVELKSRRTANGGTIMLWSDATFARNVLARLEDTVELSVDAFAFWDDADRLMLCNSGFADMHGLSSTEEAVGMSFAQVTELAATHGKFAVTGPLAAWLERRKDAHGSSAGALTVSTSDGNAFLVRERATRGGGSVTILTDVSDRRRAETALAEQTRELQRAKRALQKTKNQVRRSASYLADLARRLDVAESEADTAKSTLLRTMSHELKTPLNAIIGFADLLHSAPERTTTAEVGEYAGLIHRAGENLLRLINQILDLTRIAAGRYPITRRPLDVAAAFAGAFDHYSGLAAEKSLALDFSGCENGLHLQADETALGVMLGHLLENAVAYTQAGGEIHLSAARDGNVVRVSVADDGPGVEARDLDRILEPFEHGGNGAFDHSAGTGLGLPLVKALVELHGGTLAVASVSGEAFTATLEFPDV
jgi:two-component system cell cycle sensor histidine kinase PleC